MFNRFLWVALPLLLAPVLWALVDWAVLSAVFQPNLQACQQAAGKGACWGVIAEKWRVILFLHGCSTTKPQLRFGLF